MLLTKKKIRRLGILTFNILIIAFYVLVGITVVDWITTGNLDKTSDLSRVVIIFFFLLELADCFFLIIILASWKDESAEKEGRLIPLFLLPLTQLIYGTLQWWNKLPEGDKPVKLTKEQQLQKQLDAKDLEIEKLKRENIEYLEQLKIKNAVH